MLNIAICDDLTIELEKTYKMVFEFAKSNEQANIRIHKFNSSYNLLECIKFGEKFNIYLLDIIMPIKNGIDIGKKVRETDKEAIIIYITTSKDFAVESYEVSALDYLVKPITQKTLFSSLEKAISSFNKKLHKTHLVKTAEGTVAITYDKLVCIECCHRAAYYYLLDSCVIKSISLRGSFDDVINQISLDKRFIRPHMSFVVNMNFIKVITRNEFTLSNGRTIPISRSEYVDVKNKYLEFLLGDDV